MKGPPSLCFKLNNMKVIVKEQQSVKQEIKPGILVQGTNLKPKFNERIILVTSVENDNTFSGVTLYHYPENTNDGDWEYQVGAHSSEWSTLSYTPFLGTITLSND